MQYFGFDRPSFAFKTFGFGSSEFSPLDLFAGGKQGVWYDPSDKSTLFQDVAGTVPVTKDGDPVALMRDKSGNGNHATQSVSTARPVYKTDGILHWLEPDGVDDSFTFNADYLVNSEYHLSAAIKLFGSRKMYIMAGLLGVVNGNLHVGFDPNRGVVLGQYANDLIYPTPVSPFINAFVVSVSLDSFGKSIYIDNALKANDAVNIKLYAGNDRYGLFNFLGDGYLNGKFFGMVLINKSLDEPTAKQVAGYLAGKSGVLI